MKAKIEVSISIVLMVVILATILSLSFAWFSASNPNAYATNGHFNAAETESAATAVAKSNFFIGHLYQEKQILDNW